MGNPITITITAQSAQAAAEVVKFCNQSARGFGQVEKAARAASKQVREVARTAEINQRAFRDVAGSLTQTASLFVGPQAQQLVYGADAISRSIKGIPAAIRLAGITAPVAIGGIAALTGAVAIGAAGWSAYKARLEEVRSELAAILKQADLTKTILTSLSENRTRLAPGEADRLTEELKATAPDLEIKRAKEQLAEIAQTRENLFQARRASGVPDVEIQKEFDETFGKKFAELQAIAAKPPSSPVQKEAVSKLLGTQTNEESLKNLEKIRQLTAQTATERLTGFARERAEAQTTYDQEIAALEKLKLLNPTPEEQAEVDRAADALRAKRDEKIAESYRKERAEQEQLAQETRQFYDQKEQQADAFYRQEAERESQLRLQKLEADLQLNALTSGRDPVAQANYEFEERKRLYDDLLEKGVWTEQQLTLALQMEAVKRVQAEIAAEEQRKQLRAKQVQGVHDMFGNMATAARAFGAKGFAIAKGFAVVQATMDTASAAIAAYKAVVGIPYVGPALAPVAAAAAIAAGAAQVAAITAQQPPGYAAGGRPPVGELAIVGERGPELFVPDQAGTILPAHQTRAMMAESGSSAARTGHDTRPEIAVALIDSRSRLQEFLESNLGKQIIIRHIDGARHDLGMST